MELLVVLGIIALLVALVAPQVIRYLGDARSGTARATWEVQSLSCPFAARTTLFIDALAAAGLEAFTLALGEVFYATRLAVTVEVAEGCCISASAGNTSAAQDAKA